jgi:O-antigen/teichoic acid export membrane protein
MAAENPGAGTSALATGMAGLRAGLRRDVARLITTGVPHFFAALLVTQGLNTIRRVLLVRLLSVDDLGRMTLVMMIADCIAMFGDLGLTTATQKYAAEPMTDRERSRYYGAGLFWTALFSSTAGLLYALAVGLIPLQGEPALRLYLLLVTPYIPLAAVSRLPVIFMQVRKQIRQAAGFTVFTQALALVLQVGATWLYALFGFFAVISLAPLSNLLILLWATRAHLTWVSPAWAQLRKLLGFGLPSVAANLAGYASPLVGGLILRMYLDDAAVGILGIGLLVANTSRLMPAALMQTALPYLSDLLGNVPRLQRIVDELFIKQTLVMLALTVAWAIVSPWVIPLLFGAKFAGAYWSALILVAAGIPYAASAAAGQALLVLNRVPLNLCGGLILLGLNALGAWLLVPRYGVNGAALSTLAAQAVSTVFSLVACRVVLARLNRRTPPAPDGAAA